MRPAFALALLALPVLACTQVVEKDRPAAIADAAPDALAVPRDGGQDAPAEVGPMVDAGPAPEASTSDAAAPHVTCAVGSLSYSCPCVECAITYEHTESPGTMVPWSCSSKAPGADCEPGNTCSVQVNGGTVDGTCL